MNNIIKCDDVSYSYGNEKDSFVLKNLELTIASGESVVILGQSGCGKSTLFNLLCGIDNPSSGQVFLKGMDLSTLSENKVTLLRAKYLGLVYQFHHLLKNFNVLDNTVMPLLIRGDDKKIAQQKAKELLIKVGLEKLLNKLPSELSGGERQRVAIARAMIVTPECLLADEPTGNLDIKNTLNILELMHNINSEQKVSLVIATHDERIAKSVSRVLVLKNGTLS